MRFIFGIRRIVANRRETKRFLSGKRTNNEQQNIIHSAQAEIQVPDALLPEFVFQNTSKWHDRIALECGVTGRKYSHDQIRVKSENLGKGLRREFKLEKGDVIAILLPNCPEYGIAIMGCLQGQLIATTGNPIYKSGEIARQLKDAGAKVLIIGEQSWDVAQRALEILKINMPVFVIKMEESGSIPTGAINFHEFVNRKYDFPILAGRNEEVALMPYSSGTTGLPKGVLLSHRNITANIVQVTDPYFELMLPTTEHYQEVLPLVLPMFHIYGLSSVLLTSLSRGAKIVTLPKFQPDLFLSTIVNHKGTLLCLVPPIVNFLSLHPDVKPEHLDSVRNVSSGAAPLGALDEEKFRKKVARPITIIQGYGLTETSPCVTLSCQKRKDQLGVAGSIGEILGSTTIKVIAVDDDEGKPLGPHEKGELLVKGPQVMLGYHNREEETEKSFLDGWFRTGDMVYYDENLMFYITDRLKELIKVKGFQVAPAELEEIIRDHPQVSDAAVIGIPHDFYGEVPRAYIVPKSSDINVAEIESYVEKKVASFKHLTGGIAVVKEIPKNPAGKILRRQLKLAFLNEGV